MVKKYAVGFRLRLHNAADWLFRQAFFVPPARWAQTFSSFIEILGTMLTASSSRMRSVQLSRKTFLPSSSMATSAWLPSFPSPTRTRIGRFTPSSFRESILAMAASSQSPPFMQNSRGVAQKSLLPQLRTSLFHGRAFHKALTAFIFSMSVLPFILEANLSHVIPPRATSVDPLLKRLFFLCRSSISVH